MSEYSYERQNSIIAMDRWDDNNSIKRNLVDNVYPKNNNAF